jgi:tryptophanyl-tRNA synthetase
MGSLLKGKDGARLEKSYAASAKTELADRINSFLEDHRRKREKARNVIDKFHIKR